MTSALSIRVLADDWIALARSGGAATGEALSRGRRLNETLRDDPATAFAAILEVVRRFAEDALFCEGDTDDKQVLCNLGAGPLEDLLSWHGPAWIDAVEAEARRDRRFYWTLACVWERETDPAVWARVQAVTSGFSP